MPRTKYSNISRKAQSRRQQLIKRHEELLENVEHKTGEKDERGAWLNVNYTFDHGCKLASDAARRLSKTLLEQLMGDIRQRRRNWEQKEQTAEIVFANLLVNRRRKPVAISLARDDYIPNRYRKDGASYFTIELVRLMKQADLIGMNRGFHFSKKNSRVCRIWPKQKFLDYFETFDEIDFRFLELVNLRGENGKSFVDYNDTRETNKIRKILRQANNVNRSAEVQLQLKTTKQGFRRLTTDLHAVFNGSFEQGGRLYTGRDGYQSLEKEERGRIWINHQPTVELDFSGMQPRLLYALEGIQYDGDSYTAVIADYPELRKFVKQLLLALINAKSTDKAIASCNYNLHLDYDLFLTLRAIGTRTAELVERFKEAHPAIAHYFGKSMGLKLMRLDAKIALDVVEQFTSRNIPILAIHDSFIVEEGRERELRKAMRIAYKKYTASSKHPDGFTCPIKKEKHS